MDTHGELKYSVSDNSLEGGMVLSILLARNFLLPINFQENSRETEICSRACVQIKPL